MKDFLVASEGDRSSVGRIERGRSVNKVSREQSLCYARPRTKKKDFPELSREQGTVAAKGGSAVSNFVLFFLKGWSFRSKRVFNGQKFSL